MKKKSKEERSDEAAQFKTWAELGQANPRAPSSRHTKGTTTKTPTASVIVPEKIKYNTEVQPAKAPKQITTKKNVNPGLKAVTKTTPSRVTPPRTPPKSSATLARKPASSKGTTLSKPSKKLKRKVRLPSISETKKPSSVAAPKLKTDYASDKGTTPSMSTSQSNSYSSTDKPSSTSSSTASSSGTKPAFKAQLKMGSRLSAYASGSSGKPKKTGARLTRRGRR